MKKKLISIFICVLSLVVVTACSPRDNSEYDNNKNNEGDVTRENPENKNEGNNNKDNSKSDEVINDTQDENPPGLDIVLTMSADYDKISLLDNKKLGWGPGGPVDKNNRSQGAISYQDKYGKYNSDFILPEGNQIALTFDEGYENGYTGKILDILKEKKVSAVFFVTYPYAKENTDLIKRMIDEGHVVGNHSTKHKSFPDLTLEEAREDITNLHTYVKDNFGYTMKLFRFPMGEFNEQCLCLLNDMGYRSVFWSYAYRDWLVDEQPVATQALEQLNKKAHGGAIYLLHAVSKTNTEILGEFIGNMREKGYDFINYEDKVLTKN